MVARQRMASVERGIVHQAVAGARRPGPGPGLSSAWRSGPAAGYCLAIATRSRSSGEMKWSLSSAPASSWTQWILPLNRLPWAV